MNKNNDEILDFFDGWKDESKNKMPCAFGRKLQYSVGTFDKANKQERGSEAEISTKHPWFALHKNTKNLKSFGEIFRRSSNLMDTINTDSRQTSSGTPTVENIPTRTMADDFKLWPEPVLEASLSNFENSLIKPWQRFIPVPERCLTVAANFSPPLLVKRSKTQIENDQLRMEIIKARNSALTTFHVQFNPCEEIHDISSMQSVGRSLRTPETMIWEDKLIHHSFVDNSVSASLKTLADNIGVHENETAFEYAMELVK